MDTFDGGNGLDGVVETKGGNENVRDVQQFFSLFTYLRNERYN